MPYCVNCGVELQSGAKKCPLCETSVVLPEFMLNKMPVEKRMFPEEDVPTRKANRKSLLELLSLIFFLPIPLLLFCNLNISGEITWSGLAIGAIILMYIWVVLPLFPKRGNAIISITFDAVATLFYLYYIEYMVGGTWFLRFALPLTLSISLLGILLGILGKYTKIATLPLISVGLLLLGFLCIMIEFLLNLNFAFRDYLLWSLYPFLALVFIAIVLLYINKNDSLKEKLRRKLLF